MLGERLLLTRVLPKGHHHYNVNNNNK